MQRLNISDYDGLQWLLQQLDLALPPAHFVARHNIAPITALWGLAQSRQRIVLEPMQWGLVPPWARDEQARRPFTVARAETLHEKPSFCHLIRRYRGLVPVNGFYIWHKRRDPHYVSLSDCPAFGLACLVQMHGDGYYQCCLITQPAAEPIHSIQVRQPLIITAADAGRWLQDDDPGSIDTFLQTRSHDQLQIRPVSSRVNDLANQGPECLQ